MVTFRFYVVSTVAFFLALAVGIVIGSALDERIVDSLENQVTSVENDLDDTIESIDDKEQAIDDLERYVEESAPYAVENQLTGTALLVVAEAGTDSGAVEALVRRSREAGAVTEGIVWVEPRLDLAETGDREELAETLDLSTSSAETMQGWTWAILAEEVSERTGTPAPGNQPATTTTADSASTTTTTTPAPDTTEPYLAGPSLTALADAGFVSIQTVDGAPATTEPVERLAVVLVTGTGSDLAGPGTTATALAIAEAEGGATPVVAAVHEETEDGPERGSTVQAIRDDPELSGSISTVDDLDLIAGRVATVLAVADAEEGLVGHYGYGRGAQAIVPPWSAP